MEQCGAQNFHLNQGASMVNVTPLHWELNVRGRGAER